MEVVKVLLFVFGPQLFIVLLISLPGIIDWVKAKRYIGDD